MPSNPEKDEPSSQEPTPKKKSKKIYLIILIVFFLLCAMGGAYWYFAGGGKKMIEGKEQGAALPEEYEDSEETVIENGVEKTIKTKKKKLPKEVVVPRDAQKIPVAVPLDVFTVNLKPASSDRFLQIALILDFSDVADAEAIKPYIPTMRNSMLVLMSNQNAEELSTPEGKEKLRLDLEASIRKVVPKEKLKKFYGVLFTAFVIQ